MFDVFAKNTLVPLILRLALAAVFIYHGMEKLNGEGNELGFHWQKKQEDKPSAPEPPPAIVQGLVAWGELIGGLAVGIGFLTRVAAGGLALIMAGAIYTTTGVNGFSSLNHGFEYNYVLIMISLALILLGAGQLGVDRVFKLRRQS